MNGDTPQTPDGGDWQFKPDSAEVQPSQPQQQATTSNQQPAPEPVPMQQQVSMQQADDMPQPPEVSWSASEFIAHEKSPLWYAALTAVSVVFAAVIYFLMHDLIAVIAVVFVCILFGFLAAHKPRVLTYYVNAAGITIGQKTYSFSDFKSFGVVNEGAFSNITFMPMKRFMPTLSIYYPPEHEQAIIDVLSNYLPFAPATHDLIDRFMHRIRL